jgi:uncharacterized protein YoxC
MYENSLLKDDTDLLSYEKIKKYNKLKLFEICYKSVLTFLTISLFIIVICFLSLLIAKLLSISNSVDKEIDFYHEMIDNHSKKIELIETKFINLLTILDRNNTFQDLINNLNIQSKNLNITLLQNTLINISDDLNFLIHHFD